MDRVVLVVELVFLVQEVVVLVVLVVVAVSSSALSCNCCGDRSPRVIVAGTSTYVWGGVSFWNATAIAAHIR